MLSLHQDQTIHPAENFISMNLFQNFFFDNIGLNEIQLPSLKKKTFFSFKCQKCIWRSTNFWFLNFFKVVFDFQSKYHVQSDLSYNLKQARIAYSLQFSSYSGGHCKSSDAGTGGHCFSPYGITDKKYQMRNSTLLLLCHVSNSRTSPISDTNF